MKNFKILFIIVALAIGFTSCLKETDVMNNEPTQSIEDIVVSPDFNYETFKDIEIVMTGYTDGVVEVLASDGAVYQKAYLQKKQQYAMNLTIPTYEKTIYLRFKGKNVRLELTSDMVVWEFVKY